jgi:hypothetical protein
VPPAARQCTCRVTVQQLLMLGRLALDPDKLTAPLDSHWHQIQKCRQCIAITNKTDGTTTLLKQVWSWDRSAGMRSETAHKQFAGRKKGAQGGVVQNQLSPSSPRGSGEGRRGL